MSIDTQSVTAVVVQIVLAVAATLAALLYRDVKAWLAAKTQTALSELSNEQAAMVEQIANIVVAGVEQLRRKGSILDARHAYDSAFAIATRWLEQSGVRVDATILRAAIESAVANLPKSNITPPAALPGLPTGAKWE